MAALSAAPLAPLPASALASSERGCGSASAGARLSVSPEQLDHSLRDALAHSSGALPVHRLAVLVLKLQQSLESNVWPLPASLSATLAAVGTKVLGSWEPHALAGDELLLLEACLCVLAQISSDVAEGSERSHATVGSEAVHFALRTFRASVSASACGYASGVLASAAQSTQGWPTLLEAWRALVDEGSEEAEEAASADAGAFCERLLVMLDAQLTSMNTRLDATGSSACRLADVSDTHAKQVTDQNGDDEEEASRSALGSLEWAEAIHQLESAFTWCVQIAGFLGIGCDVAAEQSSSEVGNEHEPATALSVASRVSLLARIFLIASGNEPQPPRRPHDVTEAAAGSLDCDQTSGQSVCARVSESAQTALSILLVTGGWERTPHPPELSDLGAAMAERLAGKNVEDDALLRDALLHALAVVEVGEPARRAVSAGALRLAAEAVIRAEDGSSEQLLALRAIQAGCGAAANEAVQQLDAEHLGFLIKAAHAKPGTGDATEGTDVASSAQAREAAAASLDALRVGWRESAKRQSPYGSKAEVETEASTVEAAKRLVYFAAEGAGGDASLRSWALGSIYELAKDPVTRPELIEGGALTLVARLTASTRAQTKGAGTFSNRRLARASAPAGVARASLTRGAISNPPAVPHPAKATERAGPKTLPVPMVRRQTMPAGKMLAAAEAGAQRPRPPSPQNSNPIAGWGSDDVDDTDDMLQGSPNATNAPVDKAAPTVRFSPSPPTESPSPQVRPPKPQLAEVRFKVATPPQTTPLRNASPRSFTRGRSTQSSVSADAKEVALPPPPRALSRARTSHLSGVVESTTTARRDSTGGSDAKTLGAVPLAALRSWLTYSDADVLPSAVLTMRPNTLRVLCGLAGEQPRRPPNNVDQEASALALLTLRALLGADEDAANVNAERLRHLVLAEPRRVPTAVEPTSCIEAILTLLDEQAAQPNQIDSSLIAPRLLCILQAAVEHRSRMLSPAELTGPLQDRFDTIARFVAAVGSAAAGESLTSRAVELACSLCEGWTGPRNSFLRDRAALSATSSLLGHPANNVQQRAMQLLLSLSTADRKAVAPLVATGAVQASLDVMAKAMLDPSPEAEDTANAATQFLRNLVARDRSVLRLLCEHPACSGIEWPKF